MTARNMTNMMSGRPIPGIPIPANTTKAAASNATAANTTKAAASNANSASSSNPINKIGQAIVNGLKGLGNLITGNKK
jgi:hypothetical protein